MRFQVPQFLETETKLIGPFTLVQFLWVAGGAVLVFILNFLVSPSYLLIFGIIIILLALAFAYVKIEGMSLISYLLQALSFALSPKKYMFTRSGDEEVSVLDKYKDYGKK